MTETKNNTPDDCMLSICFGSKADCLLNCRLKQVCADKYREAKEEAYEQKFRRMEYMDRASMENDFVQEADFSEHESGIADEMADQIRELDAESRRKLQELLSKESIRKISEDANLELIRKLGELYVFDPVGFELLFLQMLANGNQVEL